MAMSHSLKFLDDEISKRHMWRLEDVVLKGTIKFESHKREWKFLTFEYCKSISVVVTCLSFYNEEWDVTVGVTDKHQKEIAASKAEERKEGNTFKAVDLIKRARISVDSELIFFVEIARKEDGETQAKKAGVRKLQSRCEEMLLTGKNSDVTLVVQGKEFNCHKCILAARSPFFCALFENNMEEDTYIMTVDIKPTVFQEFLLYLYTGSGKHLSWDNFGDLHILGCMLKVEPLIDLCKVKKKKTLM